MESVLGYLHGAARPDMLYLVGASTMLALSFHVLIQTVEFEQYLLGGCVLSFSGLTYVFYEFGQHGLPTALGRSILVSIVFHAKLVISIGVYRLAFHRCRNFPGPFGAKLSRLYVAFVTSKKVQYNKELQKMHARYGDFVRTGPREITILRKSAVDIIYGTKSVCRKSTWYGQTENNPKKCSLHMTRDFHDHRIRRRAWDRGLSIKSLAIYEPRVKAKADLLMSQLRRQAGRPVNFTDWSMFFAFDVMGAVGFGKDFGQLYTGSEHSAIKPIHEHIKLIGIFSTVPWLLYLLGSIPGAAATYQEIFDFCANEIRSKQKTWDVEKPPDDIVSWLLKAVEEKSPSAAPTPRALDDDSRIIMLAGR